MDEEDQKNYPLNVEPAQQWQFKRPIIAMVIMIFGSSVAGLIALTFSESVYVSTIVGLSVLMVLILMVAYYYILRGIEYKNPFGLARFARILLIPFRIVEMILRKIYL